MAWKKTTCLAATDFSNFSPFGYFGFYHSDKSRAKGQSINTPLLMINYWKPTFSFEEFSDSLTPWDEYFMKVRFFHSWNGRARGTHSLGKWCAIFWNHAAMARAHRKSEGLDLSKIWPPGGVAYHYRETIIYIEVYLCHGMWGLSSLFKWWS